MYFCMFRAKNDIDVQGMALRCRCIIRKNPSCNTLDVYVCTLSAHSTRWFKAAAGRLLVGVEQGYKDSQPGRHDSEIKKGEEDRKETWKRGCGSAKQMMVLIMVLMIIWEKGTGRDRGRPSSKQAKSRKIARKEGEAIFRPTFFREMVQ